MVLCELMIWYFFLDAWTIHTPIPHPKPTLYPQNYSFHLGSSWPEACSGSEFANLPNTLLSTLKLSTSFKMHLCSNKCF